MGVAVRWQLAPSHPLTLREKAHALFYPRNSLSLPLSSSLSLSLSRSVTNSPLTSRSFSSRSHSSKRVLRSSDAFPESLPYFPSDIALRLLSRLSSSLRRRSDSLLSSRFRSFLSFAFQTNVSFLQCVHSLLFFYYFVPLQQSGISCSLAPPCLNHLIHPAFLARDSGMSLSSHLSSIHIISPSTI